MWVGMAWPQSRRALTGRSPADLGRAEGNSLESANTWERTLIPDSGCRSNLLIDGLCGRGWYAADAARWRDRRAGDTAANTGRATGADACGSSTLSSSALLIRAAANIAIALTLFVVAWLGEGLFDFPRCDIRGWLASSCVVTLSLGLAIERKVAYRSASGSRSGGGIRDNRSLWRTVSRPRVPRRCTCAQCAGRFRDISVASFSRAHHLLGRGLRATVAATWSPARACERRSGGRSAAASSSFSQ